MFCCGNFRPFLSNNVQIWDHFLPFLFPKNFESLKSLDIWLWEVGAKRRLKYSSKVNRQTDKQTHRWTFWPIESIGPEGRCFEKLKNSKWDKTQIVTKLKNSSYDKLKNAKCDKTQKLKLWPKLKLWWTSKT